jgi:hypothetical protein
MTVTKLALACSMTLAGYGFARQPAMAEDNDNARKLLSDMTDDALEKSDVDDIIEWFAAADRERMDSFEESDQQKETLNGRIQQIRNAWKAKYGHDFNVDDGAGGTFKDGTFKVMDEGGKLMLMIPAMGDMKEVKVPLVREGGGVRIDVADSMTGEMVYNAVLETLTKVGGMSDKWPADETTAYRAVNSALLTALGKGAGGGGHSAGHGGM